MDLKKKIGEFLIEKGLISDEQLVVTIAEQQFTEEKLGDLLVRLGFIDRSTLVAVLAEDMPEALIQDVVITSRIDVSVPEAVLVEAMVMPVGDTGKTLYVASIHDDQAFVTRSLGEVLGDRRIIKYVPAQYQKVLLYLNDLKKKAAAKRLTSPQQLYTEAEDVNEIIEAIIHEALDLNASDIHIESTEKTVHIRNRLDGILHVVQVLPQSISARIFSRIKDMSNMDISERRLPQDGSFSITYNKRKVDFRVSTLPSVMGEKITIRVLDKEKALVGMSHLGITKTEEWLSLTKLGNGLVLVCGATGSGKTTTLYSTVKYLDSLHRSIYTIEDPVEYTLPFITQVQVNQKLGLGFGEFLRTVLRHDPDIGILGEIRDNETAENAVRLADTGHLVFGTLHTNDVPSSLTRLGGLGVDLSQIAFLLRAIMVQKLIRKLCTICKGEGCDKCNGIGYWGRTLLTELAIFNSPADIAKILDGTGDYYTFSDDYLHKLKSGITDAKELERATGKRYNPATNTFSNIVD